MTAEPNPHEEAARWRKVAKLAAHVPTGRTVAQNERIARAVERLSAEARRDFAALCHVAEPSEATWASLVEVLLARTPVVGIGRVLGFATRRRVAGGR